MPPKARLLRDCAHPLSKTKHCLQAASNSMTLSRRCVWPDFLSNRVTLLIGFGLFCQRKYRQLFNTSFGYNTKNSLTAIKFLNDRFACVNRCRIVVFKDKIKA